MENVETPYDLLEITIAGETMAARPVEFIYESEDDEHPQKAIKYETTCPGCSNLVQFAAEDIRADTDNNLFIQGCNECPVPASATEEVIEESEIESANFEEILNDEGFRNPLDNGSMKVEGIKRLN